MATFNKIAIIITTVLLTLTIYVTQTTADCDLEKVRQLAYTACDIVQDNIYKNQKLKVKRENSHTRQVETTYDDESHNFTGRYHIPKFFEIKDFSPKCGAYLVVDHSMAHLLLKPFKNVIHPFQHINLHHDHHQCSDHWKNLNVTSTSLLKNQDDYYHQRHHHQYQQQYKHLNQRQLQHQHDHQRVHPNSLLHQSQQMLKRDNDNDENIGRHSIQRHNLGSYYHAASENEVIKRRKRSLSRKISMCCASENTCAHDLCMH